MLSKVTLDNAEVGPWKNLIRKLESKIIGHAEWFSKHKAELEQDFSNTEENQDGTWKK